MSNYNTDTSKVALFDLDGTLADYDLAYRVELAKLGLDQPSRGTELPRQKALRKLIQNQPGFWRNLPRYKPGFDIYEQAFQIGFSPMVLTQGPMGATPAWTEKVEWVKTFLPDVPLTITRNKSLVYGRVLVDDWPDYFMPWLMVRPRGIVICPLHPWNENVRDDWCTYQNRDRVILYDGSNLNEVKQALDHAFNRPSGKETP